MDIKLSFPLSISSVNMTKSPRNCGFGHIYWRNLWRKTFFFVQYQGLTICRSGKIGLVSLLLSPYRSSFFHLCYTLEKKLKFNILSLNQGEEPYCNLNFIHSDLLTKNWISNMCQCWKFIFSWEDRSEWTTLFLVHFPEAVFWTRFKKSS